MIANYIKIALRNMAKQKGYSFINIAGLAIGMTCAILIMLYIKYELSYDTFHKNSDRIFRVALNLPTWNYRGATDFCKTTGALAPALMEEFSEVVFATRINAASGPFRYQENRFVEEGIYADKHFFNVFTYPLSSGDKNTALQEPFSIVLSRELANKYFGDENPIGKVISFRDEYNYKVTGIIESVPENSHLQYDYILSFSSYEAMGRKGVNRWGTINYCTYALLQNAVHHSEFDAKLSSIVDKYNQVRSEETRPSYFLQPLTSIHLESHLNFEMFENSDLRYVYIFTSIAFVILLIACINYMNLATARATKRYKEIGIRKAIGAKKLELIKQFLGESLFFTLLAMIISILWIWVVLPYFSTFVDRDIMFSENVNLINVFGMFVIVTIVGIISGIYPAFLLSSFKPVNVLKSAGAVRIKQSESTHVVI